jgi:hypothetical protein
VYRVSASIADRPQRIGVATDALDAKNAAPASEVVELDHLGFEAALARAEVGIELAREAGFVAADEVAQHAGRPVPVVPPRREVAGAELDADGRSV